MGEKEAHKDDCGETHTKLRHHVMFIGSNPSDRRPFVQIPTLSSPCLRQKPTAEQDVSRWRTRTASLSQAAIACGTSPNDLANGIAAIAEELTSGASTVNSPAINVEVEGTPRNLNPVVRDEAYRIASEALRNAVRHSQAKWIVVEIRYDKRQFRLRVRDDGKGIADEIMRQQPAGHFGLAGMRERAAIVGGSLDVWTRVDFGTQIDLSIPGNIAYGGSIRQA
jgi:two-component sensor histidine kinase